MRLRKKLSKKVALNWERVTKGSAKSTFAVCHKHHALVESYSQCGLCRRKLTIGGISVLGVASKDEAMKLNNALRADNIPSDLHEHSFVCKTCKTFCTLVRQRIHDPDYLRNHKHNKGFYREYRRR